MNDVAADPRSTLPRIALMLGDCTGIGPEQSAKILHDGRLNDAARIVVVGDVRVLELGMRDAGVDFAWRRVPRSGPIDWSAPGVPVIDLGNIDPATLPRGQVSPESGRLTGETLKEAIEIAKAGLVDAITFAPLNKAAMYQGGWKFADEHKMFANMLGHNGHFAEMNVLDGQWMSRVTGHLSLREAIELIDGPHIKDAIVLAHSTMRRAGIANPRIAVGALNPHAGENGLFGRDEIEVIRPAVEEMAAKGIDVRGPFPADTVFLKAFAGEYDGVLSMYHDAGQVATKLRGFNRGVTVTAGLQSVFTTPAHGTAFDIVGKGVAETGAIETAVRLAAQLVRGKGAAHEQAA